MFKRSPTGSKGQLVRLAGAWGSKALEKYAEEIASTLLATASDADRSDAQRITAVEQFIDVSAAIGRCRHQSCSTSSRRKRRPSLPHELIAALSASQATGLGKQLIERVAAFSPLRGQRRYAFC